METSPAEKVCPAPEKLSPHSRLGSLPWPFDLYGPPMCTRIGCESVGSPWSDTFTSTETFALGIDSEKPRLSRAFALSPLPPPQPAATRAVSKATAARK